MHVRWNRAHFGAWCIVSAPLILGLDLYSPVLDTIIPIITNKEALAVNQVRAVYVQRQYLNGPINVAFAR